MSVLEQTSVFALMFVTNGAFRLTHSHAVGVHRNADKQQAGGGAAKRKLLLKTNMQYGGGVDVVPSHLLMDSLAVPKVRKLS